MTAPNWEKKTTILHPSGVAKSSTSFGWGKGGKVTAAGWQVTLCDPIWHVISRSSVVKFHKLLYSCFYFLKQNYTEQDAQLLQRQCMMHI